MKGEINKGRRQFLIGSTCTLGAVGVVSVATPFAVSWEPNDKVRAASGSVKVDTSKIEPGQQMTIEWQGQPVWVVKRTQKNLNDLPKLDSLLEDPHSQEDQQPSYADNEHRSIKPDILVLVGICTHLGCSPNYRPDIAASDLGENWKGGFVCPCHGSRFDLAGRVFKHYPAPLNLLVPPYYFENDTLLVIGESREERKS